MRKEETTDDMIERSLHLFKESIPTLSVLSDENRQKIIMAIAQADRLNVGQISEQMTLSRPAISHHLKTLKQAGLIDVVKEGTENYYYLTLSKAVTTLKSLIEMIEASCTLK